MDVDTNLEKEVEGTGEFHLLRHCRFIDFHSRWKGKVCVCVFKSVRDGEREQSLFFFFLLASNK